MGEARVSATREEFSLDGQSILVTGGTGSFGTRFVETVLKHWNPRRLIIFSRDELKQAEMAQRLQHPALRFFIGDVRDAERLRRAFAGVSIVVHAAALKQVPAAEYNPIECIKTNVMGAENVINAAIDCGVRKVIGLSSDKAANPINLYGATKLCADKLFVAANHLAGQHGPRFAVVRYGNVVGSRGSVIPLFLRLRETGRVPVTDRRMTRFWITLQQGVEFVLACLGRMRGGEIFVPKIPSMTIMDLVTAIAPHCEVDVVGIRPGEKLHEVMIPEDDGRLTVEFDDYYVIRPAWHLWSEEEGRRIAERGRKVPEGFRYSSDTNDRWLTVDELRRLVDDL